MLVVMSMDQRNALGDTGRWLEQATRLLANLGFSLVEADRSSGDACHLLVALRPSPTLQHFDPEEVSYWVVDGNRGRAARLDREAHFPIDAPYAWGRITITDRLGVANQFLSFGGALRAQMTDAATVIAEYSSFAPILRWSGHSQGLDPLTAEVGAFFGRMKVPIDFVPGAEELVSRAAPRTLYCSFVQDVRERLSHARTLRDANRWLAEWTQRETQRLETAAPENWKAALELRQNLGLVEAVARE